MRRAHRKRLRILFIENIFHSCDPAWRLPLPACGERVGVRGRRRRRCREDCLPNAFDISLHFVIPETQDAVAMFDKPLIPDGVASAISVLAAIDLDDEPLLPTDKIHDIRPDRLLTHEFESAERPRTKVAPKLSFGGRRIFPQSSRQTRLRYLCAAHASRPPHPTLSPHAGRGRSERRDGAILPRSNRTSSRIEQREIRDGRQRYAGFVSLDPGLSLSYP